MAAQPDELLADVHAGHNDEGASHDVKPEAQRHITSVGLLAGHYQHSLRTC
jgi:hypothetical protein